MVAASSVWVGRAAKISRRAWIGGVVAAGFMGAASDEFTSEVEDLKARLTKASLGRLRLIVSRHYLAIGNAPERFLKDQLGDCEFVAEAYFDHLRARKFEVAWPKSRMTIVALRDAHDYRAYLEQENIGSVPVTAGIYLVRPNRLVVWMGSTPELDRVTISHEATHQLTFSTGLLARDGDVPKCIGEGFAGYGEWWYSISRSPYPGQHHAVFLRRLDGWKHGGSNWIPLPRLLVSDGYFGFGPFRSLAYAESWILIHYLMNTPSRLAGFRGYLSAIKGRRSWLSRLADAKQHLGDVSELERDVQRYLDLWLRG